MRGHALPGSGGTLPLEPVTFLRLGSFNLLYPVGSMIAYAQSWALVTFLMHRYPKEFIAYQKKYAAHKPEGQQDLEWLLEALGKDLRALESEFLEFMKQYPTLPDPAIERMEKFRDVFNS
jgi:hypothetical protein